jgi:hypothetical protein
MHPGTLSLAQSSCSCPRLISSMAYVLSLPSTNPLERPFTNPPCMRSFSSFASQASLRTVLHHTPRSVSEASTRSASSTPNGLRPRNDENGHPQLASRSLLSLIHDLNSTTPPGLPLGQISRQASLCSSGSLSPVPRTESIRPLKRKTARIRSHRCTEERSSTPRSSIDGDNISLLSVQQPPEVQFTTKHVEPETVHISNERGDVDELFDHQGEIQETSPPKAIPEHLPFKRWLSTLRRKNQQRRRDMGSNLQIPTFDGSYGLSYLESPRQHCVRQSGHRKSLSLTSSLGLLTAVKSASMTLTVTSLATKSRAGTRSARLRGDNRSSRFSDIRTSFESTSPSVDNVIDEKAWARSVQRRKIVEELLYSEENYIVDMKALVNVRTRFKLSKVKLMVFRFISQYSQLCLR